MVIQEVAMTAARVIRALLVFSTVLAAGSGLSPSAAQEAATEVGFVEAVSGRVVAFARGAPVLVDVLDVVGERTRFDLLTDSELRVCHYRLRRFVTMRGPAIVTVSADGITVEAGPAVDISEETCAAAQASKFQGGIVARGVPSRR
jgi:hypothetical protein